MNNILEIKSIYPRSNPHLVFEVVHKLYLSNQTNPPEHRKESMKSMYPSSKSVQFYTPLQSQKSKMQAIFSATKQTLQNPENKKIKKQATHS